MTTSRRTALKILGVAAAGSVLTRRAAAAEPIKIGLSAAFSGPNATAGQALQRGADLAIEEINSAGGVLGRQLALAIRDNEHKLDRGVAQTRELIEREGCVGDPWFAGKLHRPRRDRYHPRAQGAVVRARSRAASESSRTGASRTTCSAWRPTIAKLRSSSSTTVRTRLGAQELRYPQRGHRVGRAGHRRSAGSAQDAQSRAGLSRQDEGRRQ